ncbi:putative protein C2orf81 [Liparis tanakae]|uniref:Uncharacterized protein n=1 Tax=Liparis tanakae TaxID=230148 RepID=A0A4Z2EJJ5_9TELE|nr:putative protein C2orf81 [Liparis tanakae]
MPRSAVKSQADKRNRSSVRVTPPPSQDDIVPGRLTRAQWTDMLMEDADETAGEIMEELMTKVMDGCLQVYIERQEDDDGQVPVQTEPGAHRRCHVTAQTKSSPKQSEKETSPSMRVSSECHEALSPRPAPKIERKKKQWVHLPPVPSKLLPRLSCSAEKRDVHVEGHNSIHSLHDHTTGSSYHRKTEQPIQKLDPSCFPRHCVFPQYEIVDYNDTKPNSKKPSGLSTVKPRHSKQRTDCTVSSLKQLPSSKDQSTTFRRTDEAGVLMKTLSPSRQRKDRMLSSGSLRMDTMVWAKGVSLSDSQEVGINTHKCNPPAKSTKPRPIRSDVAVPMLSVDQVTTDPPPEVTPLFQSK